MSSKDCIYCKLFEKEIASGLCSEIGAVLCKTLLKDSVPELSEFTREEIDHACDNCPYAN